MPVLAPAHGKVPAAVAWCKATITAAVPVVNAVDVTINMTVESVLVFAIAIAITFFATVAAASATGIKACPLPGAARAHWRHNATAVCDVAAPHNLFVPERLDRCNANIGGRAAVGRTRNP